MINRPWRVDEQYECGDHLVTIADAEQDRARATCVCGWRSPAVDTRYLSELRAVARRHVDPPAKAPMRYLSRPEVAARIDVKPDTLNRYKLPEPDAQIGARQVGWLPETIDAWNAARPSRTRVAPTEPPEG